MSLSQSSSFAADPLSDVLSVLGARVTRCTRLEAAGSWALAFPSLERLKFVALLRGAQWMMLPGRAPLLMTAGDVCLIGRTPYAVASDPATPPRDGQALFAGCDLARLGGDETIGIGGTVTFAPGHAEFLLDMLPDILLAPRASDASGAIAAILALLDREASRGAAGGEIVRQRLGDILFVEAVRAHLDNPGDLTTGWLWALSDPRLGRAIRAIHAGIEQAWTVARLAEVAGMSRAAFAAAFARHVGQAPLGYVRGWRLTLARADLARGDRDVAGVATRVGYSSQSAFAHAFKRAFGMPPTAACPA